MSMISVVPIATNCWITWAAPACCTCTGNVALEIAQGWFNQYNNLLVLFPDCTVLSSTEGLRSPTSPISRGCRTSSCITRSFSNSDAAKIKG